MKRGQKVNYKGFSYTVKDTVKDGVYITRSGRISKVKKTSLDKINKHTVK